MDAIVIHAGGVPVSEVRITPGVLSDVALGKHLLPPREGRSFAAVLTQPPAAVQARALRRALHHAGMRSEVRIVPDREEGKTLATAEECYLWLNDLGLTRDDTIVGVGGGAVTDLAGFVAATYLRGIECVLVPTTLLAAVDAAIGGKTGLNVGGKNLVGAFKHPTRVLIDPEVIERLPDELLREGAAEAIKTGIIGDVRLVELYEASGLRPPMQEVIERSVRVKAAVVSDDFDEQAGRAILNYGHTLGHAIEVAAGISHGHGVSIGMVAAAVASERELGFAEKARHVALLQSVGLPVVSPPVDRQRVENLMRLDKKRDAAGLRMVLLDAAARPVVRHVADATVDAALEAVGIR